jgi:hypothetical protein
MKAADIILNAANMAGIQAIGDTTEGTYSIYALGRLNSLLDSWQVDELYIPFTTEVVQTVTGSPVTIGTGQTINVALPRFILDTSFFRLSNTDYPLQWVDQATFNCIANKSATGTPTLAYYDAQFPVGNVYFYPKPQSLEAHLQINAALPQFADLTTDYDIGKGYQMALECSLAELLCVGVREVPVELARQAIRARRILRLTNLDVPQMRLLDAIMPAYGWY